MANNFGALANSLMVHDMMDDLVKDLRPLLGLATNFGEETSDGGIVRKLRPGTTVSITDWAAPFTPYTVGSGGYIAPDYTARTPVAVTLPTDWKATSIAVTTKEFHILSGAPREDLAYQTMFSKVRQMMMQGLKEAMIADFHAIITAAAYPTNTVTAAGTYTRSKEIDVDTALFGRNLMSRANATTILTPAAYGEWVKDQQVIQNYTGKDMSDLLMMGGRQSGATASTHWRTNVALPADAARGYAFTKTAALFVARLPDEQSYDKDPVSLQEVVDPETGLSFLTRLWKDAKTGTLQFDIAIMWKFQKLQAEALERLTAA